MSKPRESCDGCDSDDYDIHTCGKTVRRRAEVEPPRPICEACGEIEVLLGDWCEQCGIIESRRGQKALELLQEFDTWGAVEHDDITDHETMLTALKFIGDFIPKARALLKDGER